MKQCLALLAVGAAMVGCGGGGAQRGSTEPRPAATSAPASRPAAPQPVPATVRRLASLGRPVYCGGGRGREVALTFDDGPGPYTRFAVDQVRGARARVTWFLVGRNIAGRERSLAATLRVGELGDHSWNHPLLPGLGSGRLSEEIARTQAAVAAAVGSAPVLFRPPYAARNARIDQQAQRLGLVQVLWNVDSGDAGGADKHGIARNVIAGLAPGSIVLLHENRGQTIQALRRILPALRRRRLRAVTVSELLARDPPSDAQLRAGRRGCRLFGATDAGLRAGEAVGRARP